MDQASQISRQIQQFFKQEQELQLPQIAQMGQLLTQLQQEISQYGREQQAEYLPSAPILSASLLIVDHDLTLAQQIAIEAKNWD